MKHLFKVNKRLHTQKRLCITLFKVIQKLISFIFLLYSEIW